MGRSLSDIANGVMPTSTGQNQVTFVQNPNYCGMQVQPQKSPSTIGVDLSTLIQNAAGYFEMDVDASSTSLSATVIYGFGGAIVAGNGTTNKQLYEYPNLAFAVDTAAFLDAFTTDGTTHASAGASGYLNQYVFPTNSLLIGDVTFQSSGTTASYNTLAKTSFLGQTMNVRANFYSAKLSFAPDICSPCFNADSQVIHWGFDAGISSTTPLTINIPVGTVGTFRLCVKGYESVKQLVETPAPIIS